MAVPPAVRNRVERLCRGATDPTALYRDVVHTMSRAVPADRWCGLLLDPATVMNTGGYHDEGLPRECLPRLLELEVGSTDVNLLPALARDRVGVSTVHRRTRGRPETSGRYREVLRPAGLGPELRAVLRDHGRPWGALILFREADAPDFSDDELRTVGAIAPEVAAAVRRTLLVSEIAHRDTDDGPGMAVLRADGGTVRLEMASQAARVLLDQVPDTTAPGGLPVVVTMMASRLAVEGGEGQRRRVRLRSGRWVSLQLDTLSPEDGDDAAQRLSLVIERVGPYELAGVIADAYGLTGREREVARLVVSGYSNPQVASALHISIATVQDHLKKVFAKLGVTSRHELTARMFFDQYLPRQLQEHPVGGDGWYIPAPS
jgi:DNA-binding CsgD family transcriptional regulator/GAF domain-containing protein